jgi:hypothetical protein
LRPGHPGRVEWSSPWCLNINFYWHNQMVVSFKPLSFSGLLLSNWWKPTSLHFHLMLWLRACHHSYSLCFVLWKILGFIIFLGLFNSTLSSPSHSVCQTGSWLFKTEDKVLASWRNSLIGFYC